MEQIFQIRWTSIAVDEFEETVDWLIENWNEEIAKKFASTVISKIERVSKNPFLGSPSEFLKDCRKTLAGPHHLIIYKVSQGFIEIIRVFDGRQNPDKLL